MLELIKNTIADIKSYSFIEVLSEQINPPIDKELLSGLQYATGKKISLPIENFYLTANGLNFTWRIKPGLDEEMMQKIYNSEEEPGYDYNQALGAIRLLPLEEVLINDWKGPKETDPGANNVFPFIDKEYSYASFGKMLFPFEIFSNLQCMAFIFFPSESEYKVMMLDNFYADWHHSRLTDFETYIKLACDLRFSIPGRQRIFKKFRGDQEPLLEYASMNTDDIVPELFQKGFLK